MRYIYLDETVFQYNNENWIGYGALVTNNMISPKLIDNAIVELKNIFDTEKPNCKQISRTIQNGYFHAKDDPSDAHSVLCKQIKNINAEFKAVFIKDYKEKLLQASLFSSLDGINSSDDILLIYEDRADLKECHIKDLYVYHEKFNIINTVNRIFMPTYFPQIFFQKTTKQNSGIQFVDFILWSLQRYIKGKNDWFDRIKINSSKYNKSGNVEWKSKSIFDYNYSLRINKGIKKDYDLLNLYKQITPKDTNLYSDDDIIVIFEKIYQSLMYIHENNILIDKKFINKELSIIIEN